MTHFFTRHHANKPVLFRGLLLILVFLLGSCQAEQPAPTEHTTILVESSPTPIKVEETAASEPTAVPPKTATATAVPPNTATPSPTPTPTPTLSLFIPPAWEHITASAIEQLNTHTDFNWQLANSEPESDIALSKNDGELVHREPLVLAVPYNAAWDSTDEQTALNVIENGHPLVQVIPWKDINPTQKAMHLDGRFPTDTDYPFYENWFLTGETGHETAVATAAPILQTLMSDPVIHIAAVGDIMLDRTLGNVIAEGDIEFPFKLVADPLQQADITIGNLESALGNTGEPVEKSYTFQSPPAAAASLAWGGFDVISLANNHALDYGSESLLQGIELLKEQKIAPIGAGANAELARAPHIISVNGLKVAFLAYVHVPVEAVGNGFDTATWTATETTPGLAWAVPAEIVEDVTAVSTQADLIVVMLHSGYEYVEPPSAEQAAAAHAAIDAGAHLVVGHHAHILQAVEFYKQGVIAYGLGNFAFNIDGNANTAILHIWLDHDGIRQFEFTPAIVQYGGQPRLATPEESSTILGQIYRLSQGFPIPSPEN